MPYYAIDSNSGNEVHVDNYVLNRNLMGNALCKIQTCQAVFGLVNEHNPNRATHFRHPNGTNCPSIPANAIPYQQLHGVPINVAQITAIKTLFLNNLHKIFNKCKTLIPNLSFREFYEVVETANNFNIWGYVNINIEYIPYILCTCKEYFRTNNPYRPDPFHFVFDSVQSVDQLWINTHAPAGIIYRVNRNTQDVDLINIIFDLNSYSSTSVLPNGLENRITNLL